MDLIGPASDSAQQHALETMWAQVLAAYEAAGCFDESRAEQLYDVGISPAQAARMSPETEGLGYYKATAGYKFANGDLAIEEVA